MTRYQQYHGRIMKMQLTHKLVIEMRLYRNTAGAPHSEIAMLVFTKTWLCAPSTCTWVKRCQNFWLNEPFIQGRVTQWSSCFPPVHWCRVHCGKQEGEKKLVKFLLSILLQKSTVNIDVLGNTAQRAVTGISDWRICESHVRLSMYNHKFLSSDVSHNFLLRSLRGPDGYIGHWG